MDTVVAFDNTESSCGLSKELLTKTSIWTESLHVSPGTPAAQPFPLPTRCETCRRHPWLYHTPSQFCVDSMQSLCGHPFKVTKSYIARFLFVRPSDRVVADRAMGHATRNPLSAFKCIFLAWASVVYVGAIKALPSLQPGYALCLDSLKKHTQQLWITTVQNSATISIGTDTSHHGHCWGKPAPDDNHSSQGLGSPPLSPFLTMEVLFDQLSIRAVDERIQYVVVITASTSINIGVL